MELSLKINSGFRILNNLNLGNSINFRSWTFNTLGIGIKNKIY